MYTKTNLDVFSTAEEEIPASKLKNYYKSVSEHKDITKLLMVLTSVVSSCKAEVMTCLDSFTQFHSVWDEDKQKTVAVSNGADCRFHLLLERFSIECRKTKTWVITLANHKGHRESNEPIKTRSNYM